MRRGLSVPSGKKRAQASGGSGDHKEIMQDLEVEDYWRAKGGLWGCVSEEVLFCLQLGSGGGKVRGCDSRWDYLTAFCLLECPLELAGEQRNV